MSSYDPDRAPPADVGRALVEQIAREDLQAMENFYAGYQSSVYRFACAQLDDSFAAAEVLNEVMMQVWRHAVRRPAADPLAWVLAMTHRAVQQLAPSQPAPRVDAITRRGAHVIAESALRQNRALLRRCLNDLSTTVRAAIHLALVEDLPVASIAAVLGCGESDVRICLRDATAQIRSSLAGAQP